MVNMMTNVRVSIEDASQDFSKVARLVDEQGSAIILKNDVPRYLIVEISQAEDMRTAEDGDIVSVSSRLIARNREAYEVLAQ